MGFYNNDSFKKIKKIFYIVAIISMLLSIKSKVFAALPNTFFKQDIYIDTENPMSFIENSNLTLNPVKYTLNDDYSLFTIIVKSSPNDNTFDGYLVTIHKGEKLKIQYSTKKAGLNRAYPTLVFSAPSGVCIVTFNIIQNSNMQNVYNNRFNDYANSDFWWFSSEERSFAAYSFTQFNDAFPNNIFYSSNSVIDFYNDDNEQIDSVSPFTPPSFDNVTEIENGYPDGVFISAGDLTKNNNIYFHLLRIDNTVSTADGSIYYYSDKTFLLNEQSKYYSTYYGVEDSSQFYYYVPRARLTLDTDSSYIYVLNNSATQIQNSNRLIEKDVANGIYDVLNSDTTGVISATEAQSDKLANIEQQLAENQNGINNIENNVNDAFNNTTVSSETQTEIDANLNFNNQNSTLNNLNGGFFTRLTTMISNLIPYNLSEDTTINIPYPNSNQYLTLHSNIISSNLSNTLILIINSFWVYIFSFYLFKFINKIYIAVSTGNILDTFNSNDEAITNNML